MSLTQDSPAQPSPAQPSPAEAPPPKALKTCLGQIGSLAVVPGTRTSSQSTPSHWPAHRELHPLYPIMGLGKTYLGPRPALLPFFHSDPQSYNIQCLSGGTQVSKLTSFLGQLSTSHPKSQLRGGIRSHTGTTT